MYTLSEGKALSGSYRLGEKLNIEYDWGGDFQANIVHFYFQLLRTTNTADLEYHLRRLLSYSKDNPGVRESLVLLYKMIAFTRDRKKGQGEWALAYMQLFVWFEYYPELALFAYIQFFENMKYGSWKDVKLFSHYVYSRTGDENHAFIELGVDLLVQQLVDDSLRMQQQLKVSHAAKWTPREKSKYKWLHCKIALKLSPEFLNTAKTPRAKAAAMRGAKRRLRKLLSAFNEYTQNTATLMCSRRWYKIDFDKVSAQTIYKHRLAFQNKNNNNRVRDASYSRYICAGKFRNYIENADDISGSSHIYVEKLVKAAYYSRSSSEADIINKMWANNAKKNSALGIIIPILDISSSLEQEQHRAFFAGIGLALRLSEITRPPFRERVLIFSACPQWLNLAGLTFVEKVTCIKESMHGLNSNLEAALQLLISVFDATNISPSDISTLTLCLISDMQVDIFKSKKVWPPIYSCLYDNIKKKFASGARRYPVPKMVFYNVRKTAGVPLVIGEKNTYLLSGYNAIALNNLQVSQKKSSPYNICQSLFKTLNNVRYYVLEYFLYKNQNKIIRKNN